jgi:hypothetical protein
MIGTAGTPGIENSMENASSILRTSLSKKSAKRPPQTQTVSKGCPLVHETVVDQSSLLSFKLPKVQLVVQPEK